MGFYCLYSSPELEALKMPYCDHLMSGLNPYTTGLILAKSNLIGQKTWMLPHIRFWFNLEKFAQCA